MERKITILKEFFEDPQRTFHMRELARLIKINHTTVRQYLNKLAKQGFLAKKKGNIYDTYTSNISPQYLNLKLYYNLEKLRKSNLINHLEKEFDLPIIVLFGSYAKAQDTKDSDIDICIISNIKKQINTENYEHVLKRKMSLHIFTKKEFEIQKQKNPGLVNSLTNGLVVSGELEII